MNIWAMPCLMIHAKAGHNKSQNGTHARAICCTSCTAKCFHIYRTHSFKSLSMRLTAQTKQYKAKAAYQQGRAALTIYRKVVLNVESK